MKERTLWDEEPACEETGLKLWEVPLPERMRPRALEEFVGQEHLVGADAPLRRVLEKGNVPSCILYGPPGVGKTTLVRLMASVTGRRLLEINAVTAKVAELRDLVVEARQAKARDRGKTALAFVDEIYHFNRQQQNVLLPAVEKGELILVGTTTENPFFEINKTLLSRMVVYEMKPLSCDDLEKLVRRALADTERGLGKLELKATDGAVSMIAAKSGGDVRQALIRLEAAAGSVAAGGGSLLDEAAVERALGTALQRYDRAGDDHYAIISALIKSMRGSDPDAAVYWLARLLAGGEDVRFIARRILIFASEDVGLADPQALSVAASAAYAADFVGLPEAQLVLSEAVLYMAAAPKSNSSTVAIGAALDAVNSGDLQEVPENLKPRGQGYLYPHDDPRHWVPQKYLREPRRFYTPGSIGFEAGLAERLKGFWKRFSIEGN
jgi:putative ATPase